MKHRWSIALAVVVFGLGAWAIRFARPRPPAPQELTFLFTGDVRGRLVPCGCFTGQFGGLTRIASLVGLGQQPASVKVDVGDAIAGPTDYEQIEARYLRQAFAAMGYDALNAGHREARLSSAALREIKRTSPVPMLGANLLDQATGRPIFDTFRIIRRGAWRIGIVGVMDSQDRDAVGEGLALENMDVTLGRLLPALRTQVDFLVLLACTDEAGLASLAKQFYELDVVLGGNVKQPSQQLVRENHSLILATTNQSRALGTLKVVLAGRSKMTPLRGEIVLVSDQIPQAPEIAALAAAYREEIRNTRLAIDNPATLQQDMVPGVKAAASYTGTQSCTACHPGASARWHLSAHARAWKTLVQQKADADPDCIACHSVGFGTPTGYRRAFAGALLAGVGCESCHGPGSQHVAQRQSNGEVTAHFRPLGAGDCVKCHHGEFSRPFDYNQFWPAIAHGREQSTRSAGL